MGKERFDYFGALEKIVDAACEAAGKLAHIIQNYDPDKVERWMREMHVIENDADMINHKIDRRLATEFITPIDRDDMLMLAQCLDQVVDTIEEVAMRFYMYDIRQIESSAIDMMELIKQSVNALKNAIAELRNFRKSKVIHGLLVSVSDYEEAADETYVKALRMLHTEHRDDPLYVMEWDAVITRMEKCCDACAHAADMVGTIITKTS